VVCVLALGSPVSGFFFFFFEDENHSIREREGTAVLAYSVRYITRTIPPSY